MEVHVSGRTSACMRMLRKPHTRLHNLLPLGCSKLFSNPCSFIDDCPSNGLNLCLAGCERLGPFDQLLFLGLDDCSLLLMILLS